MEVRPLGSRTSIREGSSAHAKASGKTTSAPEGQAQGDQHETSEADVLAVDDAPMTEVR